MQAEADSEPGFAVGLGGVAEFFEGAAHLPSVGEAVFGGVVVVEGGEFHRVNGFDLEADSRNVKDTGFACRRYPGGLPSEEMIRTALREAGA